MFVDAPFCFFFYLPFLQKGQFCHLFAFLGNDNLPTRMVVQRQLVEPAVCFIDLQDCKAMIHPFIRQQPNNIMLRQQTLFLTFMNLNFNL